MAELDVTPGGAADAVGRLKKEPGDDLIVLGGGGLIQALARAPFVLA